MALFQDNFTGSENQIITARSGWTTVISSAEAMRPQINASNQLKTPADAEYAGLVGQDTGGADHYIQFTALSQFPYVTSGRRNYACVRVQDTGEFYAVTYSNIDNLWELWKGASNRIGTYSATFVSGTVVRLEAEGSTIRVKLDGVTRISETNTDLATQTVVGIQFRENSRNPVIDDWESNTLGDVTAPTLTSATATATGATTATGGVTTDEAGPAWAVLTTSSTTPSAAQIKAGQSHTGAAASASDTATLSVGANSGVFDFTGLTGGQTYWLHVVQDDAVPNTSTPITSASSITTPAPDTTNPTWPGGTTLGASNKTDTTVTLTASADATDNVAVAGYEWSSDDGASYPFTSLTKTFQFTALTALTSYPFKSRAYDAAGNKSAAISLTTSTYRAGDTAANIIANTGPIGGNPEGFMRAFAATVSPTDWVSYRIISGPTPAGGVLTANPDGSFSYVGPVSATMVVQPEVNMVDAADTILVELYDQTDVTAPVLTSPTAAASGHNASTGSVSTNEAGGTLYWLTNTSATATATAVKAGSSQAVTAPGTQNTTSSGLSPSTGYYTHFLHRDAAGNDSTVATSAQFTTAAAPDVDPPVLSSPFAAASAYNASTGSVSTNEAGGTLYWLTNTSPSASAAAVKAGSSQAVAASGVQNTTSSGLSGSTLYYTHFLHRDAAGNDSTVASTGAFSTPAAPDVTPPTLTSPLGAAAGSTSSVGSVSTNEANGTLYWLTNTSATATAAAVKAGQSKPVTATGTQSTTNSGLSPSTAYYTHFLHRDAAGNDSTVASSAVFNTSAPPAPGTAKRGAIGLHRRLGL